MKQYGLTLIEILIALVIFAIALTAIITALQSNTRDLNYLENKILAHAVAMNIIDQTRLGVIVLNPGESLSGSQAMLQKHFTWQLTGSTESPDHIITATAKVFLQQENLEQLSFNYSKM